MATFYIDPTWVGTKSGTFAQPWSAYSSLPALSAGDFVLQKAGTTATENVVAAGSGTNGNPITYGVYKASTGAQVTTTVGAATIAGTSSVTHNFSTGGQSFVEIVGFRFSNIKDGTVYGCRLGSNSSGNTDGNAARYCTVTNETCAGGFLLFTNLGVIGHTIDHCVSSNNSVFGILQAGSLIAGKVTITNNTCNYNAQAGFRSSFSAAILVSGTIANNTFNYNGVNQAVLGKGIGIDIISDTADLQTHHNDCSNNYIMGIRMGSFSGTATANNHVATFNTCTYNGEYGMQVSTGGGWFIANNTCNYNGSNRGNFYGRGIEIYGGSSTPAGPGVVCYNECSSNYNYGGTVNNGTEGAGIGFDDYHRDIRAYGNLIVRNEGNGIQMNPNGASGSSVVYGNILIDNFCTPLVRAASWVDYLKSQICSYSTEANLSIYNNTILLTAANAPACLYGISESSSASGASTSVCNNLIKGAHRAAMKVRSGIIRTNNGFHGCTKNVESNAGATTLTDGTGAVTAEPELDSGYRPRAAAYRRTGANLGGKDYNGKQFYNPPNIGAVEDETATPRYAFRRKKLT